MTALLPERVGVQSGCRNLPITNAIRDRRSCMKSLHRATET